MKITQRQVDITSRYLRGETLQATGVAYGIGRERVRQIVARTLRLTFGNGLGSLRAELGSHHDLSRQDLRQHAEMIISRMRVTG